MGTDVERIQVSALDQWHAWLGEHLRRALDAVPAAREAWDGFPRSAKRAVLAWLVDAKRAPTRDRRITETVAEATQGRRAHQ